MPREDDMRFLLAGDLDEMIDAANLDAARLRRFRVVIEERIEKDVFRGEASHVAPHVGSDGLDLAVALFRICLAQIGDGDVVAPNPRPNAAGDTVGEIERAVDRQQAQHPNHRHRGARQQPIVELAQPPAMAERQVLRSFLKASPIIPRPRCS